jgi:hypothetical protein
VNSSSLGVVNYGKSSSCATRTPATLHEEKELPMTKNLRHAEIDQTRALYRDILARLVASLAKEYSKRKNQEW